MDELKIKTIVAIATAVGQGAVGIVRLSGPCAIYMMEKLFQPKYEVSSIEPRKLYLGYFIAPNSNLPADEVLAVYFKGSDSFTGEDCVEFQAHGGEWILQLILESCIKLGARLADPGEFTKRAFFNGRIDLSQAEAVASLIAAENEVEAKLALNQLRGALGQALKKPKAKLKYLISQITYWVDFDESDEYENDLQNLPVLLKNDIVVPLEMILTKGQQNKKLKNSFRLILAGPPNAGKSSLFNALLGQERALVSNIAGTTRDYLQAGLKWNDFNFELIDTAGLTETPKDSLDALGQKLTLQEIEKADLIIWVHPKDQTTFTLPAFLLNSEKLIIVQNKADLSIKKSDNLSNVMMLEVSAKNKIGLIELQKLISEKLMPNRLAQQNISATSFALALRHEESLLKAISYIKQAINNLVSCQPLELALIDLSASLAAIGEISGETSNEDILTSIFQNFCLGK